MGYSRAEPLSPQYPMEQGSHRGVGPCWATLVELLQHRAAHTPDRVGYVFLSAGERQQLTYGQLHDAALRVGSALRALATTREPILLLYPAGLEFLKGFFGALYAGLIPVPLPLPSGRAGGERVRQVQKDSGARLALTTAAALVEQQLETGNNLQWFCSDKLETSPIEAGVPVPSGPEDVAYLQYTSGSTSEPRGVVLSHWNILHNLANIDAGFQHTEQSVAVSWLPHFHDMGLIYGLFAPLYGGFPCYFMSPVAFVQRPRLWLEAISEFRATHSGGPNFAYELCIRRIPPEEREGLDLSSWEVAFNGAEPVHADTLERFAEAFAPCGFRPSAFYPAYGLAEAALKVTGGTKGEGALIAEFDGAALALNRVRLATPGSAQRRRMVGCGRPGLDTQVLIVDPETRLPCAAGEVGEIWVQGPGVARGYWNRPGESAETFQAHLATGEGPYLRTGDLGFLYEGQLFIAGRRKDLIIIRGLNHYPNDIELTVRRCDPRLAGSLAAAFGVEADGEERLVVVIEAGPKMPPDPEELAGQVRRAIAEGHLIQAYAVAFVRKGSIPRTSSGKIQRSLCRSLYLAGKLEILYESRWPAEETWETTEASRDRLLQAAPRERQALLVDFLREELARALQCPLASLDVSRPVTEFGVDSLVATTIAHAVEQKLQIPLQPIEFLEGRSVRELAAELALRLERTQPRPRVQARNQLHPPLSPEQERLWWLEQVFPGSCAYQIPFGLRIEGEFAPDLARRAVESVVARHETLRARFFAGPEGLPVCEVVDRLEVPFDVVDLRRAADPAAEANRRAMALVATPFDLNQAPLFRLALYRTGETQWVLAGVMHHLISDLWSVRLFLEEFRASYAAIAAGEMPALLPLPVQYGDFALWQRERLEGSHAEELANWWRAELDGAVPAEIPPDRPRPELRAGQAAGKEWELGEELQQALQAYCRAHHVTPFVVLFAAFCALVSRLTGRTEFVVGTTTANRPFPELDALIGFFATPLPVRVRLPAEGSWEEVVERAREAVRRAQEHQELPFARIAEACRPPRQAGNTPLLRVVFSQVPRILPESDWPGLQVQQLYFPPPATDFDLFWNWLPETGGWRAILVYQPALFDARSIDALLEDYRIVLRALLTGPGASPATIELANWNRRQIPMARVEEKSDQLIIASTFTAEPLEQALRFWLGELDFPYELKFAPYGQLFQQLLDPASLVRANRQGVNVLLLRLEDWAPASVDDRVLALEENADHFLAALSVATRRTSAPFLVFLCPDSPVFRHSGALGEAARRVAAQIQSAFAGTSSVHVAPAEELERWYPVEPYYDAGSDRDAHVPYTELMYVALATWIARKLHAIRTAPFKVIVLDCDQTLWRGVCGEDGPENVVIDPPRRALQEFMLRQRDAGMLLCLCSKNNEQDVWDTFAAHPEMPLRKEHFVAWRINWQPKSANLRSLARELDLGLDSFIFVDDSPAECAEVEANAPEVLTLQLPRLPEQIPQFLEHIWAFDHLTTTEEDKKRSAMYGQRLERRRLEQEVTTLAEFLEKLQLEVHIGPARPEQLPRVAQLTQRTNQMNFTTIRRTEAEIRQLLEEGKLECLTVHVTDRFGSYGLVGVMMYAAQGDRLVVDTFLLSCRAMGRGVEHRMLAELGRVAQQRGLGEVEVPIRFTSKNQPAQEFLESVGRQFGQPGPGGRIYRFPAPVAASVTYDPESKPGEPSPGRAETSAPVAGRRALDYVRIARELSEPALVMARIQRPARGIVPGSREYVGPRTPVERRLAEIWAEMLQVPRVGVHDNFFDLGGHSLLAVQLLSRVRQEFQADLSLDVVFRGDFTVAELAKAIELYQIEQAGDYEQLLAELENLSDEEVRALLEEEERRSREQSGQ